MSARKKIQRELLVSRQISELPAPTDVARLQSQIDKLQNKVNILHETIHVLKKTQALNMRELSNREKAVLVSDLKENSPLPLFLHEFDLPGSSYFYRISAIRHPDKYAGLRTQMREIFYGNRDCYDYQRIWHKLQDRGIILSEKIIRRIMKEEGLAVSSVKHKKYHSYRAGSVKRWNIS